jgi:hypothetical protein
MDTSREKNSTVVKRYGQSVKIKFMSTEEESNKWHRYGEWRKKVYIQPDFNYCLRTLKLYYLRTTGTIPPNLEIISTTQIAWAVDYTITYRLNRGDAPLTINSDFLIAIKN